MNLSTLFTVWDAPTDPKAAEQALVLLAKATWRNKALEPELRKYGTKVLLNAVRANRQAEAKKAQAMVSRALNLSLQEGRTKNTDKEFMIYRTVTQVIEVAGVSRDQAIKAVLAANHSCLRGFTGRSIENLRRIMREWEKAKRQYMVEN
jgi:hypothetical protein